jgi:exonuclease III
MKIGTFNVDGVNGRLPVLRRWLNESSQRRDGAEEVRLLTKGIIRSCGL